MGDGVEGWERGAGGREAAPEGGAAGHRSSQAFVAEAAGMRWLKAAQPVAGVCVTACQKALLQGVRMRHFGIQLCP